MSAALAWSHTALNCADPEATEDFYTRWFGFRRVRTVVLPSSQIVFLRNGSTLLELFPADGAAPPVDRDGPPAAGTVRHIAFQTDDVDAFVSRMGDAADVSLGPLAFDDFICGWRSVWLRDPDGVVVEVGQGYHDDTDSTDDHPDHARPAPTATTTAATTRTGETA